MTGKPGPITRNALKKHIAAIMRLVYVTEPGGSGGGGTDAQNKMDEAINYLQDLLDRQNAAAGGDHGDGGSKGPKPKPVPPKPHPKPVGGSPKKNLRDTCNRRQA
jgi:hypothetical protein